MKGQISLEALILLLVILSLLGIAIISIGRISSAQQSAAYNHAVARSVGVLANYADDICILGPGNTKTVQISQFPFELSFNGSHLAGKYGNFSHSEPVLCNIEIKGEEFVHYAYVWNDFGQEGKPTITISTEFNP